MGLVNKISQAVYEAIYSQNNWYKFGRVKLAGRSIKMACLILQAWTHGGDELEQTKSHLKEWNIFLHLSRS